MKRLIYDIETSPNIVLSWRAGYQINISHDSILQERRIITIAWKWHGEKKVYASNWDARQNDRAMLEEFIPILNNADESVAHFGDSFDLPWLKTRALWHGIQTLPKYKTIDTKQWASRYFYFNSNKLDYIAKFLGSAGKIKTEYELWKKILLNNDREALAYMVKYNKRDVLELEKVFDKLALVVPHHTHAGVLAGAEKWTCPKDGSRRVKTSKNVITARGTKQFQMQCRDCGTYYTISEPAHQAYLNR